jgi:hypothetical protein
VVSTKGIKPDPDRVKSVMEMKFPSTARRLQKFLGIVNYYRDFIRNYSHISSCLYRMTQSNTKFKAALKSDECFKAFDLLKRCLSSSPILAFPNLNAKIKIHSDASAYAIGGVFGQIEDNVFKPVRFVNRHLTKAERNYSATERELLALVYCAQKCLPYIYGRHIVFVTDHEPLATMKKLKNPTGRIGRLLNKIQDLDYEIVYQPGHLNTTADLLSRPEVNQGVIYSIEMQIGKWVNWVAEQQADKMVTTVRTLILGNDTKFNDVDSWNSIGNGAEWFKLRSYLMVHDGILKFVGRGGEKKVVVPRQLRSMLLNFYHDDHLAGHRDFNKTYELISTDYFWPLMSKDVKNYCLSCHLCQTKKHLTNLGKAPLKPIVVGQPWELVGIDISGPLKITAYGNKYIVLAIDYFTKFAIAKAIPDATAVTTAKFVFEEIVCRFGMPKSMISDHGVNFDANLMISLCKLCNIDKKNSSTYHPMGNGMVERLVKSIKQIVTMYINGEHNNWDDLLQPSIAAYNTSVHGSLGFSPYEVLFGRRAVKIVDAILRPEEARTVRQVSNYVNDLKSSLSRIGRVVGGNLEKARVDQKTQYDKFIRDAVHYAVGDLVVLINIRNKPNESKSFKLKAIGPYRIIEKLNELNYKVVSLATGSMEVVHYNRMKKYMMRESSSLVPSAVGNVAESMFEFNNNGRMMLYVVDDIEENRVIHQEVENGEQEVELVVEELLGQIGEDGQVNEEQRGIGDASGGRANNEEQGDGETARGEVLVNLNPENEETFLTEGEEEAQDGSSDEIKQGLTDTKLIKFYRETEKDFFLC